MTCPFFYQNIFPQMDDKGNISYEKREKKEVRKEDNINSNST